MNGILNILKPPGMTSFDVVGYLRRVLKEKKIGHTGTLDPGAVGVLPVCTGNATKIIEFITDKDKLYRAELTLGISTDTQDSTGETLKMCDVSASLHDIEEAIASFNGKINQIPPMYSAVKVDGKKLYELARNGITIERVPRTIEIYSINVISINPVTIIDDQLHAVKVLFDVHCSKGTYIRTLCADIGEKLGCGGHMSFLVRLRAGTFDIATAKTLEEIEEAVKNDTLDKCTIEVDSVFPEYRKLMLIHSDEKRLINGVSIRVDDESYKEGELVRVYNSRDEFMAIGEFTEKDRCMFLKSRKLFV
jgi:tRNA pseudouridine55 synthase